MVAVVASFFGLIVLGAPIAYVLGISSVVYIISSNIGLFESAPMRIFQGVQNFGLMAIPLFVFVGELMNSGGISKRLVGFTNVILGHFRGGLSYVNVATNMFLASILGSANAQTAMMSRVMVPEMEKQGYSREFSSALTVSSSLLGPIIPPSLVFIIYGVISETSITSMFLAGIIPGLLLTISFMVLIYFIAIRENFPKSERAPMKEVFKAFLEVLPALLIPLIILVGILSGVFTATESAAVASFVAFIVGLFFYRELKLKDLPKIFIDTAMNSAIVMFIVAMASLLSWILAFERVPNAIGDLLISISESPIVFLLVLNILLLIVGMFMDGIAAMIILVPILLPVSLNFGIDPIHLGIIICINLTIGLITPPVGTALFIASSIGKVRIEALSKSLLPFIVVAYVVLLIITYIPSITLSIPKLFS
ncbi:TRAP transporter large permease [Ammoniphilus sp. CFH 90114]|uniref:TRAP transporter large permease n=1 Tax=Ammoniphilus sp. CFH 90114 TaxID=2493665 RepID=UPI00100F66E9|nr:TRAP transporter large permease [Ammoniphilus sp. CFH 90114]RXT07002.1 TRAP transporter large permease [Ammoniphilus sp. CFH 90114]